MQMLLQYLVISNIKGCSEIQKNFHSSILHISVPAKRELYSGKRQGKNILANWLLSSMLAAKWSVLFKTSCLGKEDLQLSNNYSKLQSSRTESASFKLVAYLSH